MKRVIVAVSVILMASAFPGCAPKQPKPGDVNMQRAEATLDSLYKYYSAQGTTLLRENYPLDEKFTATYLDSDEQKERPNQYAFLWPYSGTLSAVNAICEGGSHIYKEVLETKVLEGLSKYYDTLRQPTAYASYINTASASDRFYDDNVWLGIDFTDLYTQTKEKCYIDSAEEIWKFIESGMDDKLGGGIYWCEQNKGSKNTCSNAPGAVFALKLYEATHDNHYLTQGRTLYDWTKQTLQDSVDCLYFDNMAVDGGIGRAKFAYNSGQMMQAAALLYKITGEPGYLADAQNIAASGYNTFFEDFTPTGAAPFRILKKGNIWFTAVMFRGYIELYLADKDRKYMDAFSRSLDWAWQNARDTNGLFSQDWTGATTDSHKWLLTQAAFVEMYARMGNVERLNVN